MRFYIQNKKVKVPPRVIGKKFLLEMDERHLNLSVLALSCEIYGLSCVKKLHGGSLLYTSIIYPQLHSALHNSVVYRAYGVKYDTALRNEFRR